jgi:hypothetical protein
MVAEDELELEAELTARLYAAAVERRALPRPREGIGACGGEGRVSDTGALLERWGRQSGCCGGEAAAERNPRMTCE